MSVNGIHFAVGRGFVHQPSIAPFISNIAVFHQLHCLVRLVSALQPVWETCAEEYSTASVLRITQPYINWNQPMAQRLPIRL